MDLSEYGREILKKIPETVSIKSLDPGQVIMYLALGILGVLAFITIIRPVASFLWIGEKGIRLFPKECYSGKISKKTGSVPGEGEKELPDISIRTVPVVM